MEVKELLYPEDYDFVSGRYCNIPNHAEHNRLINLIIDSFGIDPSELINDLILRRHYGLRDVKDMIFERSRQDDDNLYHIKQALSNIEQYDDISFTMNLYRDKPGRHRNTPDTIQITATNAIKTIYKLLSKLSEQGEPKKGRKDNKWKRVEIEDIVKQSFEFINTHAEGDLSKNDKLFITGIILALVGVGLPKKLPHRTDREHFIQTCKNYIYL